MKGSNSVALGFDEGVAVVKIGREEPVASMDGSGKIVWARHNEVQTVNVKSLGDAEEVRLRGGSAGGRAACGGRTGWGSWGCEWVVVATLERIPGLDV